MRPPSEASPQKSRTSPELGTVSRQALQRPSADSPHMSLNRQICEKKKQSSEGDCPPSKCIRVKGNVLCTLPFFDLRKIRRMTNQKYPQPGWVGDI